MSRFFEKESPLSDSSPSRVEYAPDYPYDDRDAQDMARLGKKQQLKRSFGFWSILGLGATIMITWEGLSIVFVYGLQDGGPAGLIYGFLFCWAGYLAVNASMGELASMAPTSAGQYHWTYMLAPRRFAVFLSYITGWQTVIAWQAVFASAAYLSGSLITGLLTLNYSTYETKLWHTTLIIYAVVLIGLIFNTALIKLLPKVETFILVVHIAGFFVVLIPLVHLSPVKASAHDVFANFLSLAGYTNNGVTFFVGIITSVFAFLGADGAVHMAEEIQNASTVVPQTMVAGILLNGVLGIAMLVAVLFCTGDIETALKSPYGLPIIEIYRQGVRSDVGATLLTCILVVAAVFGAIAILPSASRLTWAFSRDRGLPGSRILARVEPRTQLPLYSIALTVLITLLLALIQIGSAVAFNAVVSLVVAGFLGSYLLPVSLLLYRRIATPHELHWGPWHLGKFGIPVNIFALVWAVIAMFFSFWPTAVPVNPPSMNWACLLWGGTVILSLVFYFAYGKKHYKGPVADAVEAEGLDGVIEVP